MAMMLTVSQAARIIHVAMEHLNMFQGNEYPLWDYMSFEEQKMFMKGVVTVLACRTMTPEEAHTFWMTSKLRDGWTFGPVKDYALKQHPSLRPYAELSPDEQAKDALFINMVNALRPVMVIA